MDGDDGKPDFACRCLNVRIHRRHPSPDVDPQAPSCSEPDYEPLFVGEDGIIVRHNQLTIRTRAAATTDPSTSRRTQRTFVTCLVCTISVYCITTEVAQDADIKPGSVLPTEDWAEGETLTSKTGWIEIHRGSKGCIDAEEIERIKFSASYSHYFFVNISSAPHVDASSQPTPTTRLTIPSSYSFLPPLPAFLPAPPFTPSHPVFQHLAACAKAHSDNARAIAEQRVYEFAKQRLAELDARESELRGQLESLWRDAREELRKYEREKKEDVPNPWQIRQRSSSPRGRSSSFTRSPAVIREFVPSTYSGQRISRPSVPRRSALSASLATSTFHHPRDRQEDTTTLNEPRNALPSPPPYASNPSSPTRSVESSTSGSESGMPMSLKRNMNETSDAATTYRWYVIEEQEAERRKAREKAKTPVRKEASEMDEGARQGKSPGKAKDNGRAVDLKEPAVFGEISNELAAVDSKQTKSDGKRGKRHVSFKSEPAVVTIKREINDEKDQELPVEGTEELIFSIDDADMSEVNGDDPTLEKSEQDQQSLTLPLLESSQELQPVRTRRRAVDLNSAGLSQSFAALRPSSLPAPSNVRPPIRSIMNGKRKSNVDLSGKSPRSSRAGHSVGGLRSSTADTPSHRGSWSRDSDSWKIFDRKRDSYSQKTTIPEEGESDEDMNSSADNGVAIGKPNGATGNDWSNYKLPGLPSSVPVAMTPVSQLQLSSNGRSLQPKTSLTERRGALVPPLPVVREEDEKAKKSPSAIRKATYVARDRLRAMDPGVLDFMEEDDEDDESNSPMSQDDVNQVSASRGRQQALKILRAGDSVPDAGLWRSLV